MYKENLTLNNLEWLICHKTQLKMTKTQPNLQSNNHDLLMRHLILFAITKRCNIRIK